MKFIIYTDGAHSSGSAIGGIGVLFLKDGSRVDEWDISEAYRVKPTNQRCELEAIRRGLEFIIKKVKEGDSVEVHTDSSYSIGCLSIWYKNWETNGWINSKKAPVENQDIIKPTIDLLSKFRTRPIFKHVKGHSDNEWNNEADKLAVSAKSGASKYKQDSDSESEYETEYETESVSEYKSESSIDKSIDKELIIKKCKDLEEVINIKLKEIIGLIK